MVCTACILPADCMFDTALANHHLGLVQCIYPDIVAYIINHGKEQLDQQDGSIQLQRDEKEVTIKKDNMAEM